MSAIEYPKHRSYVKYLLADILSIIMCAVLCGLNTWGGLVIYAKAKEEFLVKEQGIEKVPSKATFAGIAVDIACDPLAKPTAIVIFIGKFWPMRSSTRSCRVRGTFWLSIRWQTTILPGCILSHFKTMHL